MKPCQVHSLGYFEDPQESKCPEYADPEGHARAEESPHHFKDAANDHLHKELITSMR